MKFARIARGALPAETVALAQALIGCALVRDCPDGRRAGRIVEVEAYIPGDPASHAFRGETQRNAAMFLGPFHSYVYRIYGTSMCINVTSETAGVGAAVLIRALEPVEGLRLMELRRRTTRMRDLCRGPGRLCQALDIDLRLDAVDLLEGDSVWLARAGGKRPVVASSTRIGITKAADRTLRFYEPDNPFVSGPKWLSP
ncbi:MAG: DNA-3-methyladenine glycosylase [Candidatus Eremiobacteraeota bacterium]|nr:DNA-3-methyladenine glycosylase [Candidatus Eremiobacteraeota bacterium]